MFRSEYPFRRGRSLGEEFLPIPRSFQRAIDSMLQDVWEPAPALSMAATFSKSLGNSSL